MKSSEELRASLRAIDRRSYPAYKSLAGSWSFGKYILHIEQIGRASCRERVYVLV